MTSTQILTWDAATLDIDPDLAKHLPSLTRIIKESDLMLARILTGRSTDTDASENESRLLEAQLLLYLTDQDSIVDIADHLPARKAEVSAWLRILYVVIQRFQSNGYGLCTTRLPLPSRPDKSPFGSERVRRITDVEQWRAAMFRSVTSQPTQSLPTDGMTRIAISSVLCGCLLNRRKLLQLINNLHQPIEVAGAISFIDFDLPYRGIPGVQHHRWFFDPFTELLISKVPVPNAADSISESKLYDAITDFLKRMGCDSKSIPSTLEGFIDCASSYWEARTSMIDVHFVRQRFLSQSLTRGAWLRIQQCSEAGTHLPHRQNKVANGLDETSQESADTDIDSGLVKDSILMLQWFKEIEIAIQHSAPDHVKQIVADLLSQKLHAPAPTYLGWLNHLFKGHSSSGHPLAESTIFQYFLLASPLLVSVLGKDDPAAFDPEELATTYQALLVEHSGAHPKSKLSKALREFHHYLARGNKHLLLKDTREILGDEAVLSPVEARIITFDEFESAKDVLKGKVYRYPKHKVQAALLLLILTFRLGLRRSEAAMLLLADFHLDGNPILLIRPHAQRRLKSNNSKRSIPIRYFLSVEEMRFVRAYVSSRMTQESRKPLTQYIFGNPGEDNTLMPIETLVDWIHESIREVTGDKTIHLHHLRHSFGSWTYLKLRAPDHPILIESFSYLPKTHMELRKGRRLRIQLLGTGIKPQRGYGFAVARLLGHSGPHVSMEHYIHVSDLIVWADTVRDFQLSVDKQAVAALSPLSQSQTYEHIASIPIKLLEVARNKFPARFSVLPITQSKSKRLSGRPRKNVWIPLRNIWEVLHLTTQGLSTSVVATRMAFTSAHVNSILDAAQVNQKKFGFEPVGNAGIPLPKLPRIGADVKFFDDFEFRLKALYEKNPSLLKLGLEIVCTHFNRKQGDVVFRDVTNSKEARQFLRFIDAMGYPPSQIRTIIRAKQPGSHSLDRWRKALGRPLTNPEFVDADFNNHPSYGKWIGFILTDSNGGVHPKAFALAVFLSDIIINVDEEIANLEQKEKLRQIAVNSF